jgi:dTDP-4-dehydrorhamnose 3,5-epimerase
MRLQETAVQGAYLVETDAIEDERGHFRRVFCARDLENNGLDTRFAQSSLSFNRMRGTLRGLHFQAPPAEEVKLVGCVRGRVFDVVVDLRAGSKSYLRHFASELSDENGRMHYIPMGCAHGFQTLTDEAELLYFISEFYDASLARGVRWDDPGLAIRWPLDPTVMSHRDRALPLVDKL